MAKKRKDTEDEEKEDQPLKIPKFNKKEYIKEQKRNIKAYYVSLAFGILIAIVSAGFYILLEQNSYRFLLVLLFGILTGSWLRYIFLKLNFETSEFDKKTWFGNYAIYFFTWLVIIIVLINPPIYDAEPPKIENRILPDYQELNGNVLIIAKITDNAGIDKEDITLTIDGNNVNTDDLTYKDNIIRYEFTPEQINSSRSYNYSIVAEDHNGLKTEKTGIIHFDPNTIKLDSHIGDGNETVQDGTTINFEVKAGNVDRVYYTVNDGKEINMSLDSGGEYYFTYPKYWQKIAGNKTVIVKVYAESINYFKQATSDQTTKKVDAEEFKNTIVDTAEYNFTTAKDIGVGGKDGPGFSKPKPNVVSVPGFELMVLILSLIVAVLLFKRRKKK